MGEKNKKIIKNKEKGSGLLEAMLAIAVFAIGIGAVANLYIGSYISSLHSMEKNQATLLAKEGVEAVRSIGCENVEDFLDEITVTYCLIFKGTLFNLGVFESVNVWFEWGEMTESLPKEEDLVFSTEKEIISAPGSFSETVEIPLSDVGKTFVYRMAIEDDTGEFYSVGNMRTIIAN